MQKHCMKFYLVLLGNIFRIVNDTARYNSEA